MLEVKALCKSYRRLPAIENVSFRLRPGEIVGYVGPNGSGKSTTVKIITGLLEADSGQVLFEGGSIRNNLKAYRAAFGYVPEEAHVYTHLSALEYLQLVGRLPIDRRGSWLFRTLIGRPGPGHLAGTRIWITLWALFISLTTALILHAVSPGDMRTPLITAGQLLVAIGVSLVLADIALFPVRTIPFTHLRTSSIPDFPLMIVRYFALFPFFVVIVVHHESWIEASSAHLLKPLFFLAIVHVLLLKAHAHALRQGTLETPPDEGDEFPQRLGLRDA